MWDSCYNQLAFSIIISKTLVEMNLFSAKNGMSDAIIDLNSNKYGEESDMRQKDSFWAVEKHACKENNWIKLYAHSPADQIKFKHQRDHITEKIFRQPVASWII